jgi:hypothetical protein
MSYSITVEKNTEGVQVISSSSLESIPDGVFQVTGHIYDGPGSATDMISVRGPRGEYAAASSPSPTIAEDTY